MRISMIELNAATVTLAMEALAGVALLVLLGLWWFWRSKSRQRKQAAHLIDDVEAAQVAQREKLFVLLEETCAHVLPENRADVLHEILARQNTLYKQVMLLYLNQDAEQFAKINHTVRSLIEPFCELLHSIPATGPAMLSPTNEDPLYLESRQQLHAAEQSFQALLSDYRQMQQIAEQLQAELVDAKLTLDELSSEYAKMFGNVAAISELDVSRKKVLNLFNQVMERSRQRLVLLAEGGEIES